MNGRNRTGGGQGQGQSRGQGQGRGGQGRGLMGGTTAGGAVGVCLCPHCHHSQPHERGVPCTQVKCPKCGTNLIRQ